jgi:hypothetical protein
VSAFADRLWRLKQEAGDPSYEEMSVRLGAAASRSSLAAAAKGRSLPSWETTWEFVRVLAVDRLGRDPRVTEREWREHWRQAKVAELAAVDAVPRPGPTGAAAPPAVAARTATSLPTAETGPVGASPAFEAGATATPAFEAEAPATPADRADASAEVAPTAQTTAARGETGAPVTQAAKADASAEAAPTAKSTAAPAGEAGASAGEARASAGAAPTAFAAKASATPAAEPGVSAAVEIDKATAQAGETGKAATQAGDTGEFAGSGPIGSRHDPAAPAAGQPGSASQPGSAGRRRFGIAVAAAAVAVLTSVALAFVVPGRQPDGGGGALPAAAASPDHDDSQFEGDITYPDGTVVPPNSSFTKIWRIRNTGTVFWANRFLGRVNEQPCQAPTVVAVPQTGPGETVDIAVTVRTPAKPGRCKIYWKMADEQGRTLFPLKRPIFLDVQVGGS